jgi:YVTN family beta-propeller protein
MTRRLTVHHVGVAAVTLAFAWTGCRDAPAGRLLVTSGGTDQVLVLDAANGSVVDSVSLDRRLGERDEPHGVAVAPDGRYWYATLAHGEPSLWKVETAGHRVVGRLTLETYGAARVRLSPDGSLALVPDYWLSGGGAPSRVAFVRTEDLVVVGTPELCAGPHDAAFRPGGDLVAVTCALDDRVLLVDPATRKVRAGVAAGLGARPLNAAWTPDGARVLVTLMGAGEVLVIDVESPGHPWVTARVLVGDRPAQLAVSPDGRRAVVANRGDGTVSVLALDGWSGGDTAPAGAARQDVPLPGANPHGVAFGPTSGVAYATWEGDSSSRGGVAAIDLETARLLWTSEVGQYTLGVAWARD